MTRTVLIALFIITTTLTTHARLGETPDQCEQLDLRPHRLWKAALFVDGRMTGLKSEELVMLLQEQKKELTVFKAIDSE